MSTDVLDRPMFLFASSDIDTPEDATEILVLGLPAMLPNKSTVTIGGDIEADSGMRASYRISDSELESLTLRFYETQWPDIVAWIDECMMGQEFLFYPASTDFGAYLVRLESPTAGMTYQPQPDAQYPRVLTLLVVLRARTTFDAFDIITPMTETLDFGRGPDVGKTNNTLYHDQTMTLGTLTVTWPNYVIGVASSIGWQGVLGTGADSDDPQVMIFNKLVRKISVDFEEITYSGNFMAAYDADDVEIGRCTLDSAWMAVHGKTAIIEFSTNRIKYVVLSGVDATDWVTYSHIIIERDIFVGETS